MARAKKQPDWRSPFCASVANAMRKEGYINLTIAIKQTSNTVEAMCVLLAFETMKKHYPTRYFQLNMLGSFLKRLDAAYDLFVTEI